MTDISALTADIERLENECRAAKERLHKEQCEAAGIAIGDIVIGTDRLAGRRFKVCKIETVCSKPWVSGYPERVGGGWSIAVRNLYGHWTKE